MIDYELGPDCINQHTNQENLNENIFELDHLNNEQQQQMLEMLNNNPEVFSKNKFDIGLTNVTEHEINTQEAAPIRQYPRRKNPVARLEEEKIVRQMLDSGVVRESNSPWSSPVLLTKKKDGSSRFCVDYRALNKCTVQNSYPLPSITESLESLKGTQWFTVLDLQSGFWQVPVKETDKHKTAFTTGRSLLEFQVMPYGLTNSPATFASLMEKVLKGLHWSICLLFIDDILIFGRTFPELLE
jgi:hypothetical protein